MPPLEEPPRGPARTRPRLGLALRLVLAGALFAWLLRGGGLELGRFDAVRWGWFAAAAALMLGILVLPPVRWWLLCRGRGLPIGLGVAIHVAMIGSAVGRLLWGAVSNDAVRLACMGRRHPDQRVLAMSTVVVDRYLGALALFALGPVALALLWLRGVREPWLLRSALMVGGLCAAAALLPYLASTPRTAALLGPLRRRKLVSDLHGALVGYRGQGGALAAGLGLSALIHLSHLAACWCALAALGYRVDLLGVCAVMPLVNLAGQVPITPQALGVKEGLAEQLFRVTGMEGGAEMVLLLRVVVIGQGLLCLPALLLPVAPVPASEARREPDERAADPAAIT